MSTADDIKVLLSRSLTDWSVTGAEQLKVVGLLGRDPDVSRVLADLAGAAFNLFAVARYARKVANDGSRLVLASLPNTQAEFPGLNMRAFGQNSITWPRDNISALGSEYTSRAWDDKLSPGWGDFVLEAYDDMKGSGVF